MRHHEMEKPQNDNDYFERMSQVIFMSGLNWQTLEKKWRGIKKAFANFDVNKVAKFQESKVEELMANPEVIRNLPKIRAVIANAGQIQAVAAEHGSFAKYLANLRREGGEDGLRDAISKRFAFLGKGTTVIFLFSVGEDLPKAAREWENQHSPLPNGTGTPGGTGQDHSPVGSRDGAAGHRR
jgi:DNA-3-methyladenine glycosylase I